MKCKINRIKFAVVDHITRSFIKENTVTAIYQEWIETNDINGSLKITDIDYKEYTNISFSWNYPKAPKCEALNCILQYSRS